MRMMCDLRFERIQDAYDSKWTATDLRENLDRIIGDQSVLEIERYLEGRPAHLKILDIGCGMGRTVDHFRGKGYEVTGIDIARSGLKTYKAHRPDVPLVCGSSTELPFRGAAFDVILLMGVLYEIETVEAMERMLRYFRPLIRNGGRLIYVCQYPKDLWKTILSRVPFEKRWFRGGFMRDKVDCTPCFGRWVISNKETVELFKRCGWKVEKVKPVNHYYGAANWFYDLFYQKKHLNIPLAFVADTCPKEYVGWPGRLLARFSRRFAPMLCPGLVYFQFHKVADAHSLHGS